MAALTEAARHLGVSVKTARRRAKVGELLSRQVATQHGQAYEVWLRMGGHRPNSMGGHVSTVNDQATRVATLTTATLDGQATQRVDDETTVELVRLVDRLQREARDLAGLVGLLQQRLVFAEDRSARWRLERD